MARQHATRYVKTSYGFELVSSALPVTQGESFAPEIEMEEPEPEVVVIEEDLSDFTEPTRPRRKQPAEEPGKE